jgi:hypothetical protein
VVTALNERMTRLGLPEHSKSKGRNPST